ncbi:MAG: transglutaminase domain-containing protein [Fluviicola sp.]|nr:transglutaminase domain-containing protein [Fluviicola sp.]
MKSHLFLILTLVFVHHFGLAQEVKFNVKVPKSETKTTKSLSNYLTKDLSGDSAKAAVIYQWVTNNIAYDYAALKSGKPLVFKTGKDVLKVRKTVCQGYSCLLTELYKEAGISAVMVEGYTRSFRSDSIEYIAESDHEWVTFKVNNKWYLCDPTWDAGYLGRIPKKDNYALKRERTLKKREQKLDKASSVKKQEKLKKRWDKKDLKKAAKEEKAADENPVTNKIGFVKYPQLNYFMTDPDTFLITHLPSVPAFQLRSHPITMPNYTSLSANWDSILQVSTTPQLDFTAYIEAFETKKLHDQWLSTANDGLVFNPYNYSTMAVHHHNYIGLSLNDNFRKSFGSIEKSDLSKSLTDLRSMNDSLEIYIKKAQKISKTANSITKRMVARESKLFKTTDKAANSGINKVLAAQKKSIENLKKSGATLAKTRETVAEKQAKILADSRDFSKPIAFDSTWLPIEFKAWKDSLFQQLLVIDSIRNDWDSLTHTDAIYNWRFEALKYAYETSYSNVYVIGSSPIYYDDTIAKQDTLIANQLVNLLSYHNEIMPQMMYPAEVMKAYKEAEKMIKAGNQRMKKFAQTHVDFNANRVTAYTQALSYQVLDAIQNDLASAQSDRRQLIQMEQAYQGDYEIIKQNLEDEKKYKEKNATYNQEVLKRNEKRSKAMYEELMKSSKKFEAYFFKVLGPRPR